MTTAPVIATSRATQRHTVRLVHQSTGNAIRGVRLSPVRWPTGWSARVVDGQLVVSALDSAAAASVAHVDLILTDGVLRDHLVLPTPAADQPEDSVRVTLASPSITTALPPTPMVLTVTLVDDGTGAPSVGKTVTVRPSGGTPVALPATSTPGTYSSAPRVWGAAFTPADLMVGTTAVRKVSMDFTRSTTRITVVDPT